MRPPKKHKAERAKILITVKTYPLLSSKHVETVCTAGVREEGKWVRIYPVSYRRMSRDQRFKKYQWVQANIVRDSRDPRPESHRVVGNFKLLNRVETENNWEERRKLILNKVYYSLDTLIQEARDTSSRPRWLLLSQNALLVSHLNMIVAKQAGGKNIKRWQRSCRVIR